MKPVLTIILSVILSLAAALLIVQPKDVATDTEKADVYARVMDSGTIRCGYALWPPAVLAKDPITGNITGIFHDVIEAAAANMNLKVEWTEEVAWGPTTEAGLNTDRYDLFCSALWMQGGRAPYFNYSIPIMYSASHLYVRADDTRFDGNIGLMNDPQYRLAIMDGEQSALIARRHFPKAQVVATPQLGELTQLLMDVATGKADGAFLEPSLAKAYADANPGTIRQATENPYQVFANVFGARLGEERFSRMLDSALNELLHSGEIDRIIGKYEPDRGVFMPVALPYIPVQPETLK